MEIGFLENDLDLSVNKKGKIRILKSELTYYCAIKKCLILVPIGFKTDFGSIPQFLQGIFPKDGDALYAYILHDYLYKSGMFTRKEADNILDEAMLSLGVWWWRRKSVRLGLRMGGRKAWNKHRNNK